MKSECYMCHEPLYHEIKNVTVNKKANLLGGFRSLPNFKSRAKSIHADQMLKPQNNPGTILNPRGGRLTFSPLHFEVGAEFLQY